MNMKQALATRPPALPMLLLYTSILVAPVARIAVTCNIIVVSYIFTNLRKEENMRAGRQKKAKASSKVYHPHELGQK